MPLPSFEEVKDRKMIRWALAYLAGAWLTLQVVELVSDSFGWADFWVRALIVVLTVGLAAVLVIAWYHGERNAQRVTGTEVSILAALLAVAALGVMFVGGEARPAGAVADALAREVDQTTLAVLPFVAVGADSAGFADALAEGLADELLATLARSPSLRVSARTSAHAFRDSDAPADSIGRALGVAHLVEGTVRGAGGGRVRVSVRLVEAATGLQTWAETYESEGVDAFALQDQIARAVAARLQAQITIRPQGAEDPEAYRLVQDGMRTTARGGDPAVYLPEALGLFERAVARDSTYARAWTRLAVARMDMAGYGLADDAGAAWAGARSAAERAIALDPAEGRAHLALGLIAERHDGDAYAARGHYERAVAANPSDAVSLAYLAWSYTLTGDSSRAIGAAARAAALDPLSAATLRNSSYVYSCVGRHERAVALARDALALDPEGLVSLYALANALAIAGETEEAVRLSDQLVAGHPDVGRSYWVAAYVRARAGDRPGAERALAHIEADANYIQAAVEAALGRPDAAFAALERSVEAEEGPVVELAVDPWFATLRSHPRWAPLVSRVRARGAVAGS